FFFSGTGYAGGGEERIRFRSGGYDYVLFKSSIAGSWLPGGYREHFEDDGVMVLKARKLVSVQMCRDLDENASFSAMSEVLDREQFDHDIDTPCCGEKPASR
ncbi:MAG: hypothetical protein HY859_19900, partial [Caulobacterales bacterium]|nr:hypothetical protein [Caulobacterales bacterium]